nr:MAG TPA: hypothetical protein [Caudoviricetes sp.]
MKANIINTKLAKNESIQKVTNIYENHNGLDDFVLYIESDDIENLNDIANRLSFPIEKVMICNDNDEMLTEYTNYHALVDANVSVYSEDNKLIQKTSYRFG